MLGIALVVVERRDRTVDRDFMKVRPAKTADLRVCVGKQAPLQQRIVGKIDPRHDMPRAERNLLGFCEEIVRVAVEHHFAQGCDGYQFFGNQLGGVKNVKIELVFVFLRDDLHPEFPLRVIARFDGVPQITAMEVSVFACELLRFVPHQRASTCARPPVELDEVRLAFSVDKAKGMHAEALHASQAFRNGPVGHGPNNHVSRFRH